MSRMFLKLIKQKINQPMKITSKKNLISMKLTKKKIKCTLKQMPNELKWKKNNLKINKVKKTDLINNKCEISRIKIKFYIL